MSGEVGSDIVDTQLFRAAVARRVMRTLGVEEARSRVRAHVDVLMKGYICSICLNRR